MAHIRKRGKRADGSTKWQARYQDPATATKRIEKTFRSKLEAENWLTKQQASILNQTHQHPNEQQRPFCQAVEAWRETRLPHLSPKTCDRYEDVLRLYLEPEFGHMPLSRITRETIKRYFARLQSAHDPLSAGSIRKIQTVLSSVLSEAVEMGMIRVNPAMRMRLPAPPRRDMIVLTTSDIQQLAANTPPTYRPAILLAANTGMRASELWALRRKDLDLLHGKLHVRQAVKRDTASPTAPPSTVDSYGREVGTPKNGRPRTISIGRQTAAMLEEHLTRPTPGGGGPEALVFTTPFGRAIRHGVFMRKVFRPATLHLSPELRAVRFHDLRHTCASLLAAKGYQPLYLKERLGHASITTTLNLYGHMFPAIEASLADALDDMYGDDAGQATMAN